MSQRVLLCDDEIHILRAAEIKLARAGYEVECASDGQEGWEAIERRRPDILITDCQMPRLDGFGLVERVRQNPSLADLPILMLTAKGFEIAHADAAQRWGIMAILAKPFSPRQLLKYVEEVLTTGKLEIVHSVN
jgi:DNA-binding response OmpR family regulator